MALKSQVFSTTVNHYTLELTVVEDSTNTTANTSAVSYTLKLKSGGYGFAQYGVGASVSLNGAQVAYRDRYSAPQLSIGTYSSITLLSGTTTIAHNSDGTKTIAVAATLDMAKAYYTPGPMSISGQSMTLTTIPRATAPVVSGAATMGQAKTISLSPASSSFTHTLLYSFGSASGAIASDVKSSVSWTPPLSLASQVPDATSGTATITCHTYSGGTLIGTKTTTVTLQVPSSVVPTISGVTLSDATSGIAAQFGAYVQSKSALKVQISASSQYGATIRSYSTTVLGTTYTGSSVTTSPLGQSGTIVVSIKVTDSRGRAATTTRSVSVVAYSAPRITSFSADRVDSSGNADDEGTHLKVTLALSISPVGNKNTKQYKLLYKRKSDTSYTALQTTTPSDYSYSGTLTFTASSYPEFSSDYGYDIRLQVSDYFTSVNSDDELQTAAVWLDFNISGKGVGIGKVSEKDAMEVAMPVEFLDEIILPTGKFTPYLTTETGSTVTAKYTEQMGEYTKLGKLVFFTLGIEGTIVSVSNTPRSRIGGLPFSSVNTTAVIIGCIYNCVEYNTNLTAINYGSNMITISHGDATNGVGINSNVWKADPDGRFLIYLSGYYMIN